MKNKLFASVPNILFGALITIAPQTFAHACTGHDMPGACHYSPPAATGLGVVILVFGVVALFVAPQTRIGRNIAAAADALLLLLSLIHIYGRAVPVLHRSGVRGRMETVLLVRLGRELEQVI